MSREYKFAITSNSARIHKLLGPISLFIILVFTNCTVLNHNIHKVVEQPNDKEKVCCLNKDANVEEDPIIEITILQMNDVYEIAPISQGKSGGLARVAALRKKLLKENPNTYTVIAGDFFSPSAIGTAKVDGERLDGRQMVDVLNKLGLDYATFGNHEFDLKEKPFKKRIEEVEFTWISSNVRTTSNSHFRHSVSNVVKQISGPGNKKVNLGIVGVTIDSKIPEYVTITDPIPALKQEVQSLKDQTDVIIAITHLDFSDDIKIANEIEEIDLIIGGHDHENMLFQRGTNYTPVVKADANAKSVYIHRISYNTETGKSDISSTFVPITDNIKGDPEIKKIVKRWMERGFEGFRNDGFEPEKTIANLTEDYDGLESSVRRRPTNLTELIAKSMVSEAKGTDLAIFNSGSIRIDDKLLKGAVTQYDILRVLPYEGKVLKIKIKGDELKKVITKGQRLKGTGGYVQTTSNVALDKGIWKIDGISIDDNKVYNLAINDWLACGNEDGLEFLHIAENGVCNEASMTNAPSKNPDIKFDTSYGDIRQAIIKELSQGQSK